jgi:hypothetical protein
MRFWPKSLPNMATSVPAPATRASRLRVIVIVVSPLIVGQSLAPNRFRPTSPEQQNGFRIVLGCGIPSYYQLLPGAIFGEAIDL